MQFHAVRDSHRTESAYCERLADKIQSDLPTRERLTAMQVPGKNEDP